MWDDIIPWRKKSSITTGFGKTCVVFASIQNPDPGNVELLEVKM
jgi:hypothetical protein